MDEKLLINGYGKEKYKEIALHLKEKGVTEEKYRKFWNENFPDIEIEITENLMDLLFHTFI